jgi:hypothetical protein
MKQLVLATLGLIVAAGGAQAQIGATGQRPTTRPTVNPFLSSGRPTSPLTPQQADTLRLLGQQLAPGGALSQQPGPDPTLGITGHPVRYNYYSHYYTFPFPRFGPTSGAGGAPPVQPGIGAPPGAQGSQFGMAPPPANIGILIAP